VFHKISLRSSFLFNVSCPLKIASKNILKFFDPDFAGQRRSGGNRGDGCNSWRGRQLTALIGILNVFCARFLLKNCGCGASAPGVDNPANGCYCNHWPVFPQGKILLLGARFDGGGIRRQNR